MSTHSSLDQDGRESSATTPAGRLPDFVIVGAMKSGTTTLYHYLRDNPQIFMARRKEPMFFSRDDVYERGLEWYYDLFRDARNNQLCGEASTCYSRHREYPHAAKRLARHLPDAKLVYLMRHPVERAHAVYRYVVEHRWPEGPMSFEQAVETYPCPVIDSGMYIYEIEHLLRWFPREQFLFLILDDLRRDPASVLRHVDEFLGLPPAQYDNLQVLQANRGGEIIAQKRARRHLERIRSLPLVSTAMAILPRSMRRHARQFLLDRLTRRATANRTAEVLLGITALSDALRSELLQKFKPSIIELEEFLGRGLPAWHR